MAIDPIGAPLSRLTPRWAVGLCVFVAVLVCLPVLRGGFVIDDSYLVVDNPGIRDLGNIPGFFARPWGGGAGGAGHADVNAAYFRPLTSSLYALEFALFGLRPWAWHLVSLLLHATATGLCAALALRILGCAAAASVAGLVFAVHPVHSEAIAAVCYQTTLLAGLLAMAALCALGRAVDREKTGRWLAWATLAAAAAGLAKEEAVVVPLLAAAWVVLAPTRRRILFWGVGSMGLAALAVMAVRSVVVTRSGVTYFGTASGSVVALTMMRVVALYAELLVVPLRLCPFYDWFIIPPSASLSAETGLGLLLAGAWGLGVWLAARRAPAGAIGLAWVALGLLPVMHLVPILNVAAERFLYLPSVGFALALGALFAWAVRRQRRVALGVALGLVLLFSLRTVMRWPDWRDDRALNEATATAFPETPTPLVNLANLARAAGDRASALRYLDEAQRRAPGWPIPARIAEKLRIQESR